MQARLILDTEEKRSRALQMGVTDPNKKYDMTDLARGDVIVAATGVTDGALIKGVHFSKDVIHHRDRGLSLRHRHRPPHLRRASRAVEVPSRLVVYNVTIWMAGLARPFSFRIPPTLIPRSLRSRRLEGASRTLGPNSKRRLQRLLRMRALIGKTG